MMLLELVRPGADRRAEVADGRDARRRRRCATSAPTSVLAMLLLARAAWSAVAMAPLLMGVMLIAIAGQHAAGRVCSSASSGFSRSFGAQSVQGSEQAPRRPRRACPSADERDEAAAGWLWSRTRPSTARLAEIVATQQLASSRSSAWARRSSIRSPCASAMVLLILAIIDYAWQRWRTEQQLKMTKQEVKEEMRRMEGDPKIKQRRRQIAMQLRDAADSSKDVPTADVVVTNPTHFAVALKYDSDDDACAARWSPKGTDYLAMTIREIAIEHGMPILERKPLARALYKLVDVGQEIPEQFYSAVAEILAYVYELSGKLKQEARRGVHGKPCAGSVIVQHGNMARQSHQPDLRTAAGKPRDVFPAGVHRRCCWCILVPLPPQVLDLLLVVNITLSVIVLVTTIYVKQPAGIRGLSVAAAGDHAVPAGAQRRDDAADSHAATAPTPTGRHAAGEVVQTFGDFVTAGSLAVGMIIFMIIFVIQFVVITKGATRISEVAARFTLDAMPGKQMAIDADLNAGLINEAAGPAAPRGRSRSEADFYGAMDGASKFVRGDAIAGIIITFVNILGGLVRRHGRARHGRSCRLPEALHAS